MKTTDIVDITTPCHIWIGTEWFLIDEIDLKPGTTMVTVYGPARDEQHRLDVELGEDEPLDDTYHDVGHRAGTTFGKGERVRWTPLRSDLLMPLNGGERQDWPNAGVSALVGHLDAIHDRVDPGPSGVRLTTLIVDEKVVTCYFYGNDNDETPSVILRRICTDEMVALAVAVTCLEGTSAQQLGNAKMLLIDEVAL